MDINPKSWHAWVFRACLVIWERFKGVDNWWLHRRSTNVCHYLRVMLVWAPLVVAIHVAVAAWVVWCTVLLPMELFGALGYLRAIALCLGLVVGVVAGGGALFWGLTKLGRIPPFRGATHRGGFLDVLAERAVAAKHRVCPSIRFATPASEEDTT